MTSHYHGNKISTTQSFLRDTDLPTPKPCKSGVFKKKPWRLGPQTGSRFEEPGGKNPPRIPSGTQSTIPPPPPHSQSLTPTKSGQLFGSFV